MSLDLTTLPKVNFSRLLSKSSDISSLFWRGRIIMELFSSFFYSGSVCNTRYEDWTANYYITNALIIQQDISRVFVYSRNNICNLIYTNYKLTKKTLIFHCLIRILKRCCHVSDTENLHVAQFSLFSIVCNVYCVKVSSQMF